MYCEKSEQPVETLELGKIPLKVTDPKELLRKIKESKGKLQRIGLYDDYDRFPVIQELAKQNDMGYDEFVSYMIKHWNSDEPNPFAMVRSFENIYDDIPQEYKTSNVIDLISYQVATHVEKEVLKLFYVSGELS